VAEILEAVSDPKLPEGPMAPIESVKTVDTPAKPVPLRDKGIVSAETSGADAAAASVIVPEFEVSGWE
jgi:hypothetical protein